MENSPASVGIDPDNAIVWDNGRLSLLDQRLLPQRTAYLTLDTAEAVADAIRAMVVRGAPAIGITAAYAVVLAARERFAESPEAWRDRIEADLALLAASRPTAVNLVWALNRMRKRFAEVGAEDPVLFLLEEARNIHAQDIEANRRIGAWGADLITGPTEVITHCNAGALATGGYGTALGVIRSAFESGKISRVYADETRPWLQGARLTAWELMQVGVPVSLMADAAAASLMAGGRVSWVIVGADRVAANGDVANKIGTYHLALAARYHGVKVMVAAPVSTLDMSVSSGTDIPIEFRSQDELLSCAGRPVGAPGAGAWNPVFDVTPAALVDVIVTDRGVVHAPDEQKLRALIQG